MALEYIDSTQNAGSGGSALAPDTRWTVQSGCNYVTTPVVRAGQIALELGSLLKNTGYTAEKTVGVRYYLPGGASFATFFLFGSGNVTLVYLQIESDRTLSIYTSPSNVRIYNSGAQGFTITENAYHYYDFQCTLSGSTPVAVNCNVNVDGQQWAINASGNTGYNASSLFINAAEMNWFQFAAATGGSFGGYVCDIYCVNPNTTDINGHATTLTGILGDTAVDFDIPDADVTTNWSNFGGSPPPVYPIVNQVPPPTNDSEYIYSNTTGQEDTFNMTPVPTSGYTILGTQLLILARKDAEGARTISGLVGGIVQNNLFGNQDYLYDYYDYHIWPLDSDNGTPWTPTNFNAENFGVKLSA